MKKAVCLFVAVCLSLTSVFCCIGCKDEEFVDTSNAVSVNTFDNPDFAKKQEAKDDAEGREHIYIPDDAKTIEIDGEEYIPIDTFDDIFTDEDCYDRNYILKHDMDITGMGYIGYADFLYSEVTRPNEPFTGKFHGNNYKIYGQRGWPLFGYIKDAVISDIVLSSELINGKRHDLNASILLCGVAVNSTIKNITNYSVQGGPSKYQTHSMITLIDNCIVENVTNYGDVTNGCSAIVKFAFDSTVRNCKNYGNISVGKFKTITGGYSNIETVVGGIVSEIISHERYDTQNKTVGSVVENCENYGTIIGRNYIGGIVGRVEFFHDFLTIHNCDYNIYFPDLSRVKLLENPSVIRNCSNYGNIYRNKDYEEKLVANTMLCCIGGVVGMGYKIENCRNSGTIYGFETINPEYMVDYIGGVAGAACAVTDCANTAKLVAASTIEHTDDICGYMIER